MRLAKILAPERARFVLWLPFFVMVGAAGWMLAPRDPPFWAGAAIIGTCLPSALVVGFWPARRRTGVAALARAVLSGALACVVACALGACAAQWRTHSVAAPRLAGPLDGVALEGWVIGLDGGRSPRLRILVRALEGVAVAPISVRVSSRGGVIGPGRAVRCRVSLRPPDGPLAPGAYDFARRAYFERLGAVGFVWGRCMPIRAPPPPSIIDQAALRIAAIRNDLTQRILEAAPGRGGAFAAALVTGDDSAVDNETNEALRDSGLGHILSVSGLHMSVVGGGVFAALSLFFALIAPIALRFSVKKIAAFGALGALTLYLVISGASVPAIRAYVMACVAFGAILIDRPAISMRGLALAALLVTLTFPESVLEPGFQMSFAATAALIAAFEIFSKRAAPLPSPGPIVAGLTRFVGALGAIGATSIVAGLATDPFAVFHFQRLTSYSLVTNLAAAPIVTFWVTPAAAIAAIAAPFGLEQGPLAAMAAGLDVIAGIAATFAARPEAVHALPTAPPAFLLLSIAGLTWGCLWRGALRWGALGFGAAAVVVYVTAPQPSAAIDSEARALFVRADTGHAWRLISSGGRSTFARDRLGGQLGVHPHRLANLPAPEGCAEQACQLALSSERRLFVVRAPEDYASACSAGALVIAFASAPPGFQRRCAPALFLDPDILAARGGAFIYTQPTGLRVTYAREGRLRAWTPPALSEFQP